MAAVRLPHAVSSTLAARHSQTAHLTEVRYRGTSTGMYITPTPYRTGNRGLQRRANQSLQTAVNIHAYSGTYYSRSGNGNGHASATMRGPPRSPLQLHSSHRAGSFAQLYGYSSEAHNTSPCSLLHWTSCLLRMFLCYQTFHTLYSELHDMSVRLCPYHSSLPIVRVLGLL